MRRQGVTQPCLDGHRSAGLSSRPQCSGLRASDLGSVTEVKHMLLCLDSWEPTFL